MRGFAIFALEGARGRFEGCVPTGLSPVFQDPSQSADATFCQQSAESLPTLTWEQLAEADPLTRIRVGDFVPLVLRFANRT